MKYSSVKDIALKWNLSERRVRMMCEKGLIQGVNKENGLWHIPDDSKMPQDKRVKRKKVAVIVSSSADAGCLISKEFVSRGYNVIFISDKECFIDGIYCFNCKINDEKRIKEIIFSIDTIDSLVIFPSSYLPKTLETTAVSDFDYYADLIYKNTYNVVKYSISKIRKSKGNILFIHSSVALNPEPAAPVYCMLQSSLVMLGKALALREGQYGVRVNNLAIGPASTDELMMKVQKNQLKKWKDVNPLGVSFKMQDFINAIIYLAIDNSSSSKMTGCVMTVDGGESIANAYTLTQKEGVL